MDNNYQCAQGDFFSAHPLSCNWFDVVYRKPEGTPADSHLENPEDGHGMPFIDNKIAHYLSGCQGGKLTEKWPSKVRPSEARYGVKEKELVRTGR